MKTIVIGPGFYIGEGGGILSSSTCGRVQKYATIFVKEISVH